MNIKRNGIREWVFQRVSNVLIFAYALFYIILLISTDDLDYEKWLAIHSAAWFKAYSTLTLVVVMINSLLAGWQIGTDYTQKVPVAAFAPLFHSFYTIVTLVFMGFGLFILWA